MTVFLIGVVFTLLIIAYIIAFAKISYLNDLESIELDKKTKGANDEKRKI